MTDRQKILRYRRGGDTAEIELDNQLVFVRMPGEVRETHHVFKDWDSLAAFVRDREQELVRDGYEAVAAREDGYGAEQARGDFRRLAGSCAIPAAVIAAVLDTVPESSPVLVYLGELVRACEGLTDGLRGRGGHLRALFLAGDDALRGHEDSHLPAHDQVIMRDGRVIAVVDADVWVLYGGSVWRVHPEGAWDLGTAEAFLREQVALALEPDGQV